MCLMLSVVDCSSQQKVTENIALHCSLCALLQDPAVLQAINTQQHEPQMTDAPSNAAASATAAVPAAQSQVFTASVHVSHSLVSFIVCFQFAIQ